MQYLNIIYIICPINIKIKYIILYLKYNIYIIYIYTRYILCVYFIVKKKYINTIIYIYNAIRVNIKTSYSNIKYLYLYFR